MNLSDQTLTSVSAAKSQALASQIYSREEDGEGHAARAHPD